MAVGIRPDEVFNAREVYADIIDLPRWEPNSKHPRMSLRARAAQFAPFAALSGFDEMLREEFRKTEREPELGEEEKTLLDRKLNRIRTLLSSGTQPLAEFTVFVPDERKESGRYETVTARVRRIDNAGRRIILMTGPGTDNPDSLPVDRIVGIRGPQIGEDDEYGPFCCE